MKGLHLKQIVDISLFQIHKKIKRLYFSHHDSGSDINFFLCFQLATKYEFSVTRWQIVVAKNFLV